MILQGTEALTSLIHIISECLLTPVIIILVIFVVLAILCLGGVINERISRKSIKSEEFEKLVRDISFSNSPSEIENFVDDSSLFKWQKGILVKIAKNHDIGLKARQALASELISNERIARINDSKYDFFKYADLIIETVEELRNSN